MSHVWFAKSYEHESDVLGAFSTPEKAADAVKAMCPNAEWKLETYRESFILRRMWKGASADEYAIWRVEIDAEIGA